MAKLKTWTVTRVTTSVVEVRAATEEDAIDKVCEKLVAKKGKPHRWDNEEEEWSAETDEDE